MMIAAYRAERLSQRPARRDGPPPVPAPRIPGRHAAEPATTSQADAARAEPAITIVATADSASVFANLVSLAVAERNAATDRTAPASAADTAPQGAPDPTPRTGPDASAPDVSGPDAQAMDDRKTGDGTASARSPDKTAAAAPVGQAGDMPESSSRPPPHEPAAHDPPLAEIGFGPGMLIRLSQLGLHTTADLARADAGQLRVALGDISRLVDVETWISHARQTARAASS